MSQSENDVANLATLILELVQDDFAVEGPPKVQDNKAVITLRYEATNKTYFLELSGPVAQ